MLARYIGINGLLLILFSLVLSLILDKHIDEFFLKIFSRNEKLSVVFSFLVIVLFARLLVLIVGEPVVDFLETVTGWTFRH